MKARLSSNHILKNVRLKTFGSYLSRYLLVLSILGVTSNAWAQTTIFSQDFNSATTVDYGASTAFDIDGGEGNNIVGNPASSTQFTSIYGTSKLSTEFDINSTTHSGYLRAFENNTGYYWSIARTTNFSASALKLTMDIYYDNISSASDVGINFAIGSGFTDGYTSTCPDASIVHSGFSIKSNSTATITVYKTYSTNLSATGITQNTWLKVAWFINNTGANLTYTDPANGAQTLSNDTWDLWVSADGGSTWSMFVDGATANSGGANLEDFYIGDYRGKKQEFRLDNVIISNLTATTPSIAISDNGTQIAAGNILSSSTKNSLFTFKLANTGSGSGTVNTVAFTTTGNAVTTTDLTNFKLYYNTSNNLSTASQVGLSITSSLGAGSHSFTGLTQEIAADATGYFWITADIAANPTVGHTVAVAATPTVTLASTTVTGSTSAGGTQTIITAPTVTTQAVSEIATSSATGNGTVVATGGSTVNWESGFCWKTTFSPTIADSKTTNGTSALSPYTESLTGLTPNTLYYVKAYATNNAGTSYGSEVNFTTLSLPPIVSAESNVTSTGFTANWTAPSSQGSATYTYTVEVTNTSGDYTGDALVASYTSIASGILQQVVTGLSTSTNYWYRVKVVNASGSSIYSAEEVVTTSGPESQATDHFRSRVTGDWNLESNWESSSDGITWITATLVPTNNAASILIQANHTITVSSSVSAPNVTVNGTLRNNGTLTVSGSITVANGGTYDHALGGATIILPSIVWNTGSTLVLSGTYSGQNGTLPAGNYQHIIYKGNVPVSTDYFSLGKSAVTIAGDLTVDVPTSNNGAVLLAAPATPTLTVNNYYQENGNVYINRNAGGNRGFTVNGNAFINGGSLFPKTLDNIYNGTFTIKKDLTIAGTGVISNNGTGGSGFIVFDGTNQTFSNAGTITTTTIPLNITVNSTSILDVGTSSFGTSAATFTTQAGATIKTAHIQGINGNISVSGTRTLHAATNYEFYGSSAQSTGSLLKTADNVIINNSAGVTLSTNTTVNENLTLTNGNVLLGGASLVLANAVLGSPDIYKHIITNGIGRVTNVPVASSFIFPIGFDANNYTPVTISSATPSSYSVAAKPTTPTLNNSINTMWSITGAASPSTFAFTTNTIPSNGIVYQLYNSTNWMTRVGGTTVNNTTTISNVTSTSPFEYWTVAQTAQIPILQVSENNVNLVCGAITQVDFGMIQIEGNTIDKVFTLKNTGNSTLTVTGITVSTGYSLITPPPTSIASGANATVIVRFTPTVEGITTGVLTINSNASNSTSCQVNLKGTYQLPVAGTLVVSHEGSSLPCGVNTPVDFGTIQTAGNFVDKQFKLKNTGEIILNISSITISSGYLVLGTPPTILPAGDSTMLMVRFTPTVEGETTGILTINSNASNAGFCEINVKGVLGATLPGTCEPINCNLLPNFGFTVRNIENTTNACGWNNAAISEPFANNCIRLNNSETSVDVSIQPELYNLRFYVKTNAKANLSIFAKNTLNNGTHKLFERKNVEAGWSWIELDSISINKLYTTFIIKESSGGEVLIDDVFFGLVSCIRTTNCNCLEDISFSGTLTDDELLTVATLIPSKNYTLSFDENIVLDNPGSTKVCVYLATSGSTARQKIYEKVTDTDIQNHTVTIPFIQPDISYDSIVFVNESTNGQFIFSNVKLLEYSCLGGASVKRKGCNLIVNGEFEALSGGQTFAPGYVYNWINADSLSATDADILKYTGHLTAFNDNYSKINTTAIEATVATDCDKIYRLKYRYKGDTNTRVTAYLTNVSNVSDITEENSQLIFTDTIHNNLSSTLYAQDYNIYNRPVWDYFTLKGIRPERDYEHILFVTENGDVFLDEIILEEENSACAIPCDSNLVINGDFSLSRLNMFEDETYDWTGIVEKGNPTESFGQTLDGTKYIQFQDNDATKDHFVSVLTFAEMEVGKSYSISFNYERSQFDSEFTNSEFYVYLTDEGFENLNIVDYVNKTNTSPIEVFNTKTGFSAWQQVTLNCIKPTKDCKKIVFIGRYAQFKVGNVVVKEMCSTDVCDNIPPPCEETGCCNLVRNGDFELSLGLPIAEGQEPNWFSLAGSGSYNPTTSVISNNHYVAIADASATGNNAVGLGAFVSLSPDSSYVVQFSLKTTDFTEPAGRLAIYLVPKDSVVTPEDLLSNSVLSAKELFNQPVDTLFDWVDMSINFIEPEQQNNKLIVIVKDCSIEIDSISIIPAHCVFPKISSSIILSDPCIEMVANGDFEKSDNSWGLSRNAQITTNSDENVAFLWRRSFIYTEVNAIAGKEYTLQYKDTGIGSNVIVYLYTEDFVSSLRIHTSNPNPDNTNIAKVIPALDKNYKWLVFSKEPSLYFFNFSLIDSVSMKLSNCVELRSTCNDECIRSFAPIPGEKYILNAWVKETGSGTDTATTYHNAYIDIFYRAANDSTARIYGEGPIIDGWQRIEKEFVIPVNAMTIEIRLNGGSGGTTAYFDDIRVHPYGASMKSYVYDPVTLKLSAELDERNYATYYEYDEEGQLIRIKKETERGVKTIQESFEYTQKKK